MVPSKLERQLFWEVTYDDIRTKIRLHIGEKQALIVQEFQTLSQILSAAFGGKKQDATSDPNVKKPQSAAELRAAFAKQFGAVR